MAIIPSKLFQPLAKLRWIRLEHVVVIKLSLTCGLLAAYVVPAPYNIFVGGMANMVWLWKDLGKKEAEKDVEKAKEVLEKL